MECPTCQQQSPAGARFCMNCAAPLISTCTHCGTELSTGARFCPQCARPADALTPPPGTAERRAPRDYTPKHLADKILQSKSALEGERKQVTVLFADVKGSMDLQEQVELEAWHRASERLSRILAEGVHRYEGTVNQYTGDGIMALFGAPIAHEDHAQRACYAALHLVETSCISYGDELRTPQGLSLLDCAWDSTPARSMVGKIGDDLRMDYTAHGHAVGLAARMEQIAEPGKVYLTEHTGRLVEGFFQLRDLGPQRVKGVSTPLSVHELVDVGELRTRLDVARVRGFSSMVGRARELEALQGALASALDGRGQIVGVVGEAGVGKSRLCAEFADRTRASGTAVYEAHCPSHGKTVSLQPVRELLRSLFEVKAQDPDDVACSKVADALASLDPELSSSLPPVLDLLGLQDPERRESAVDAGILERQLFAFVRQLVLAQSRRRQSVLLVDDVHWIDAASDAYLGQLAEAVRDTRTLLLVNFRPEYRADWMGKEYYQRIPLQPLGAAAIDELLRELIGDDPSVAPLHALILERTGGNPFFIEEVVASLAESGRLTGERGAYRRVDPIEALDVPTTVQPVLAARIDRLAEREKQVLQTAAVIGEKFSEELLGQVLELPGADLTAALSRLRDAELICEESLYPELEYVFKHPLTERVAYDAQLLEHRRRVHAAVARALRAEQPELASAQAAVLAHHWDSAGDASEAALWHGAASRWLQFTDRREAYRHGRRVVELLDDPKEERDRGVLMLALNGLVANGSEFGLTLEEADEYVRRGRTLAGVAEREWVVPVWTWEVSLGAERAERARPRIKQLSIARRSLVENRGHGRFPDGLGHARQGVVIDRVLEIRRNRTIDARRDVAESDVVIGRISPASRCRIEIWIHRDGREPLENRGRIKSGDSWELDDSVGENHICRGSQHRPRFADRDGPAREALPDLAH